MINTFQPDAIHIATEGPIGRATRRFCTRRRFPYTTSFHTRFPEYAYDRIRFPIEWGYALLRDFHNDAETLMVATPGLIEELIDEAVGAAGTIGGLEVGDTVVVTYGQSGRVTGGTDLIAVRAVGSPKRSGFESDPAHFRR